MAKNLYIDSWTAFAILGMLIFTTTTKRLHTDDIQPLLHPTIYIFVLSIKTPDFICLTKIYLSSYFAETFWPRWAKLTGCQANNGPLTSANTHFTSQKGVKRPTHNSMSKQTSSNDIFSRPLKSIAKSYYCPRSEAYHIT